MLNVVDEDKKMNEARSSDATHRRNERPRLPTLLFLSDHDLLEPQRVHQVVKTKMLRAALRCIPSSSSILQSTSESCPPLIAALRTPSRPTLTRFTRRSFSDDTLAEPRREPTSIRWHHLQRVTIKDKKETAPQKTAEETWYNRSQTAMATLPRPKDTYAGLPLSCAPMIRV